MAVGPGERLRPAVRLGRSWRPLFCWRRRPAGTGRAPSRTLPGSTPTRRFCNRGYARSIVPGRRRWPHATRFRSRFGERKGTVGWTDGIRCGWTVGRRFPQPGVPVGVFDSPGAAGVRVQIIPQESSDRQAFAGVVGVSGVNVRMAEPRQKAEAPTCGASASEIL